MLTKHYSLEKILSFIIMLIISLLVIFPFLMTISTSLKTMAEIQSSKFRIFPEKVIWKNYSEAMGYGNWLQYFYNSFIVTIVTVALSLLFNSLAGFAFARLRFPGKKFLFTMILIGLMVPEQVTLIPMFKMMSDFPMTGGNSFLGQGGSGLVNTRISLIIPYLAAPFGIFLCRQFYSTFPKALDDAATIDGANKWRLYFQIYIPLSGPILAALGVLKTTHTWNNYLWPLVMINSDKMYTVQLGLTKFRGEFGIQWNLLMAATILVIMPLVLVFIAAQKYFISGIVTSGLKG